MNDEMLTIQQMAERSGLSVHTLRYYERIGLLDPVERAGNGHRRYAPADVERVGFLNRLRATGMSIRAMQEYTALVRAGEMSETTRRTLLEAHRDVIQARITELEEHLVVINGKIHRYRDREHNVGSAAHSTHRTEQHAHTPGGGS